MHITCKSKVASKLLKVLLFRLWDLARKMRLVESFPEQLLKFSKVPWASSYGHFIARKEFWSQCRILLFWMSGGPRADEVDLEVDFGIVLGFLFIYNTFASGPPQVDL